MDLPNCPGCGKPYLSVATRCPHCGRILMKPASTRTYEARRLNLWPAGLSLGALIAIILLVGLWTGALERPVVRETGEQNGDELAERPLFIEHPPEETEVLPVPPTPEPITPRDPPAQPLPGTEVRWLANWANIREAPDLEASVVVIMRPGQEVAVGRRVAGFREVIMDGAVLGYVATSLLLTQPAPLP